MQTKDGPGTRIKRKVIRLEVSYVSTSGIKSEHATTMLAYLFEQSIIKGRRCPPQARSVLETPRGEDDGT